MIVTARTHARTHARAVSAADPSNHAVKFAQTFARARAAR